jgi:hypothetical protein
MRINNSRFRYFQAILLTTPSPVSWRAWPESTSTIQMLPWYKTAIEKLLPLGVDRRSKGCGYQITC